MLPARLLRPEPMPLAPKAVATPPPKADDGKLPPLFKPAGTTTCGPCSAMPLSMGDCSTCFPPNTGLSEAICIASLDWPPPPPLRPGAASPPPLPRPWRCGGTVQRDTTDCEGDDGASRTVAPVVRADDGGIAAVKVPLCN